MQEEKTAKGILEKLKEKADDVIVNLVSSKNQQVKFANNKVCATKIFNSSDMGVFIAKGGKIVMTTIKDFSEMQASKTIKRLLLFADANEKNKEYLGIAEGPFNYKKIEELYDPKVEALNEGAVDYVEKGINAALCRGARRTAGVLETTASESYLLSSRGVEARDKGTEIYFSIRAFAEKDASGHQVEVSRVLNKFDVENAAKKAAETAVMAKNPEKGKIGKFDVLFSQLPFSNILDNLARGFSIFSVEAGLSCLANKTGKQIANENVNLSDDGTVPNGLNSSLFDAEGVPSQRTPLIKSGILTNYLHNTSTAKRHGTKTTANAGLISPEPTNTVIEPGKSRFDDLLSSIKKGIYVTNVWYTRFQNYNTGDFSTIPRDGIFYIENGEIKHPLKDIRISENLINVMKNVELIGNDVKQVRGWEVELPIITPSVLVKGLNITKPVE